jgi:hypothetical protein
LIEKFDEDKERDYGSKTWFLGNGNMGYAILVAVKLQNAKEAFAALELYMVFYNKHSIGFSFKPCICLINQL